eukprot:scaffold406_cov391-Prasinococcus_capsulatus_cf.AAC.2
MRWRSCCSARVAPYIVVAVVSLPPYCECVRCWCRSVGVGAVACYGDVVNSSAQRIAESLRQPHELDTSEENLQFQRGSPPRLPARTMHRHLRLAIAVTLAGCPFQPASAERLGRADIGLRGRIMTRELLSSDTMEGSDNVTMPTPVGFEEGSDNMTTPSPVDLPTPVPVPVPIPMPMGTCTDTSEGSFWGAILEQTSVADAVPGFNVSAEVCLQGEAAFPEEEFAALTASCCLICTETVSITRPASGQHMRSLCFISDVGALWMPGHCHSGLVELH